MPVYSRAAPPRQANVYVALSHIFLRPLREGIRRDVEESRIRTVRCTQPDLAFILAIEKPSR